MTRRKLDFTDDVSPLDRNLIVAIIDVLNVQQLRSGARISVIAGGASNANYRIDSDDGKRYVLRVARTDVERFGIDRWRGAAAQRSVASIGLAPPLLAAALPAGHAISPFVEGPLLDAERIREPSMLGRVAETLRLFHNAAPVDGVFSIFDDHRRYAKTARAEGLKLPDDFDELIGYADAVEAVFVECDIPTKLCHGDLQLPNIIIRDDHLVVLDWEYAGMGNPYFDLGSISTNAQLSYEERRKFLEAYFGEDVGLHNDRVELMLYMSALREATWAVIAEPVLGLDWDYQAWAKEFYSRCRRSIATDLSGAISRAR